MQTEQQTTRHIFMVRPHAFGPNPQTAASNAFQQETAEPPADLCRRARIEFDTVVDALRTAGAEPIVFEDTDAPVKPDAIFPNNWVTFHGDGRVFLYPMEAPGRRAERRLDIVEALSADWGFYVSEIVDLSRFESDRRYLEGTGSMVLDRIHRVAYAALSSRTHMDALADFARRADYAIAAFEARDETGLPVYHTNVMMALGRNFAVVCSACITDKKRRDAVLAQLAATGRDIIEISMQQMHCFAGNVLELDSRGGQALVAMSGRAHEALDQAQRARLARCGRLVPVHIDTIERVGGGSVRCMLAEIFLPRTPARA